MPPAQRNDHSREPTTQDGSSRLVTSSQLARMLGLSARTIQRYRRAGYLVPAAESPGGHARWDVTQVQERLRELAAERGKSPE